MAFDEGVAQRIREEFGGRPDITEKRMFGGIAFMDRGNMCCGVVGDVLMARVDPPGFDEDSQLREWIDLCLLFTGSLAAK